MSNLSDYKLTISTGDNVSLTGNITANNITVSTDLLVQGDLNVTGTQTITNTTTLAVNDNKVTLNSGASGTPTLNAGVVIDRGSSSDVDLRWNESTDKWEQTRDGSTYVTIPINTTELSEGTNQYYTNARARAAISVTGSGSYDSGTGVITVTGGVTSVNTLTGAVTLSTTNISEGTNLYYTDTRANTAFDARLTVKSTSNVAEGTNLYFTNARANSAMAAFTGNLTAGNASVTANISGGNLSISGISTVTGNITGANLIAGSSGLGNVYAGNVIVNGQPTTYGYVNTTVVANTSPVSSTNFNGGSSVSPALTILTLAIPTAGTWRLDAEMRVYIPGEGYMAAAFYDNGTLISGSEYFIAAGGVTQTGAATGQYSGFMSYNLTTTGARTVTMGAWSTGTSQFISSGDGRTWARATLLNPSIAVQATATGTLNTDYINAGRRTSDQTSAGAGSDIIFNSSIVSSGISLNTSTGVFTLTAGKTYKLFAELSFTNFSSIDNFIIYDWVDATTNTRLDTSGMSAGISESLNRSVSEFNATSTTLIYTPTTNQTVKVRIVDANGTVTVRADIGTKAIIEQIANTFALNALATMTTTGNVTVGGNLSVTGDIISTPAGFRATTPVTNVSVNNGASATMLFGTEEVDTKNWYNTATGRFTPNVAGYYSADWFVVTSVNGAGELLATLAKNGTDIAWGTNVVNATGHWNGVGGHVGMVYLNGTTDYISVKLTNNSGSTATVYSGSLSYFSAYLIR